MWTRAFQAGVRPQAQPPVGLRAVPAIQVRRPERSGLRRQLLRQLFNHQLKFGTQIVRNQDNKALLFQRTVTYNTLSDFAVNSPFSIGTLGQPRRGMRNTYYNLFVQDDIQVSRTLTVNAGVRY